MSIQSDVQKFEWGEYVELFDLDATSIGGTTWFFTPNTLNGSEIVWRGNTYQPIPIEGEGFERTKQGALPRPTIRISNINRVLLQTVISLGDLVGAEITRWRTFKQYLDGQPQADPNAHFAKEIFFIEQKTLHNKRMIEWEMRSALDLERIQLPRRQFLRDKGFPGISRTRVR